MEGVNDEIKDNWLFWRLVVFAKEDYQTVNNLTLTEILEYNAVLSIKGIIESIYTEKIGAVE